ncbi:MAG: antibiotic biosynthesis monooxygenase [Candidatus Helarchaeota archaeon]|nr:antibiotic biosynthesis monooxygenase [Candidatus Helarchaeota archaeon]
MITIIAILKVKDGKMEEAIEVLKEIVPKVRESETGCKAYIPHTVKGAKNKNSIIFYEKYEDKAALNLHSASLPDNFKKLIPLLEGGMDIKTCSEII